VREAKAAAARRGTTLAAVVSDALERSFHEDDGARESSRELRDAMRWYERNRPRLLSRYGGEYVAIVDRSVVDHDRDFESLAGRVFARFGVRSVFMPRVQEAEARVRVKSPRLRH
jgi:hypothetical protein